MTGTPARPAPTWAQWRLWLAVSLLIVEPCRPVVAESPVPALLKPLQLVGYPSRPPSPDFGGETVDGRRLSPIDLRGTVVLVNFWANWCVECRPEMLVLEQLHRELVRRGLVIVGVNARETTETVRRYARESRLSFPLVLDPDGIISTRYGVVGLPTTVLVGRDGRAVAFAVGPREWGSAPARALFDALLAEAAPRPTAP